MRSYLVAEMKGMFDCLRASLLHSDLEMIQRKSIRLIKCQETLGSYVIERRTSIARRENKRKGRSAHNSVQA